MPNDLATAIKAALVMTPKAERSSGFVVSRSRGVVPLWPEGAGTLPEDTVAGHFTAELKPVTMKDVDSVHTEGYEKAMAIMSIGPSTRIMAVPDRLWNIMWSMAGSRSMPHDTWDKVSQLYSRDSPQVEPWYGPPRPLFYRALIGLFSGKQLIDIGFNMSNTGHESWAAGSGMQLYILDSISRGYERLCERLQATCRFLAEDMTDMSMYMMSRTDAIVQDMMSVDTHKVALDGFSYKGEEDVSISKDRQDGAEPDNALVSLLRESEGNDCPARELWRQAGQISGAQ